jgi:predicted secreted protein
MVKRAAVRVVIWWVVPVVLLPVVGRVVEGARQRYLARAGLAGLAMPMG